MKNLNACVNDDEKGEKSEWNDNMSDDCVDLMIAAFASLVTDYNQGGDFALYTLEDKDGDEDDLTVTNEDSYFDQVW